jgi:hypothetical protein
VTEDGLGGTTVASFSRNLGGQSEGPRSLWQRELQFVLGFRHEFVEGLDAIGDSLGVS